MRSLLTILGLIYLSYGFCQTNSDTLFLKKEKYGKVYITQDTTMLEYKWLIPKDLNSKNYLLYKQFYKDLLKDTLIKIKHFDFGNLPSNWTPLYMIKDKYYLYGPSDWMANYGYSIKDSVIVKQYSDGPDVMIIMDYQQKSDNEYFFKLLTRHKIEILTIKIVDSKSGIAIMKFIADNHVTYKLMVDSKNVNQFPLVYCDCGEIKCSIGYKFEQPDYDSIIKNAH